MRAGLSTIQQTLTPEAASVLNHSIAEAGRRNHGQTTPLHVAATLLASPSGFLRQACIRSHPNSSHPLQCRALELCFSVALDRLPTAQTTTSAVEPPISNALMAALKRAQAHQRRGCPEQQQQPLLAVKVELSQLIISILDDPSVSRVMREASFSSPAVKATIEQSLNSQAGTANSSMIGIGFRPTPTPMPSRNLYLNPRLQQGNSTNSAQSGQHRNEEIKRVIDILLRTKNRNPVLVGDSEPETMLRELLRRIEKGELDEGPLKNVQVIPIVKELALDRMQMLDKVKELGNLLEGRIGSSNGAGVILDLGDLKWLVEQNVSVGVWGSGGVPQQVVSEIGRVAVAEMGKLLARFGEGSKGRVWLIGTATCETYLRCQVYHPSMEKDWDLQAVPIASRSPLPAMFPRLGVNGILSSSVESLSPLKSFPMATTALPRRATENLDPARRMSCCPQCKENYEQELAKLELKQFEKSSSEIISDATQPPLPQWLQNAKVCNSDVKTRDQSQDQEMIFKQKSQELQKKWSDTCLHVHPNFHNSLRSERSVPAALSITGLYNPNLLVCNPLQPKLQQTRNVGETRQLNPNPVARQHLDCAGSPPRSPVRTDLLLGPIKTTETYPEKPHIECAKDVLGCISSEPQAKFPLQSEKFANKLDADSFKKLLKGLMEKVWWQREAASAVANTVTQCKLGNRKQRGAGSKGDIWLLFTGPDRVGKKKMASVLSEQVCGANPVMICLGSRRDDGKSDVNFRGKTVLDRIAEAVRRNPFSVIMLEDIDEADMLVRGSIKRAMERGRLIDSHGREISIGNVIFILTANGVPDNLKSSLDGDLLDEKKLASLASGSWQLRLSIGEKSAKRPANWLHDEDRPTKPRKEIGSGLSFDLNQVADIEDDRTDGSHNSSDLTIDHESEHGLDNKRFSITSLPHDLVDSLDDAILFKPVSSGPIRREIENAITKKFHSVVDIDKLSIQVENEALEKILGGIWIGQTGLGEWAEKVLLPSFHQLKAHLPSTSIASSDEAMVVRLELDNVSDSPSNGDWLPSKITVMVERV
ncbi:protein SUPPRESSOR OF MAX2 1-like [Cornus florida]|uniref:protein SUPPRESSOR OF MAX2 1-like n=1 Tax=Cornus florida TaxID=4283 RepID=UPI002899D860|nr:protein SUPPRESSOR OF MAX2 1-like [Cornus florida]